MMIEWLNQTNPQSNAMEATMEKLMAEKVIR